MSPDPVVRTTPGPLPPTPLPLRAAIAIAPGPGAREKGGGRSPPPPVAIRSSAAAPAPVVRASGSTGPDPFPSSPGATAALPAAARPGDTAACRDMAVPGPRLPARAPGRGGPGARSRPSLRAPRRRWGCPPRRCGRAGPPLSASVRAAGAPAPRLTAAPRGRQARRRGGGLRPPTSPGARPVVACKPLPKFALQRKVGAQGPASSGRAGLPPRCPLGVRARLWTRAICRPGDVTPTSRALCWAP